MTTQADREYTLDMEAEPARVPQARRIVAAHLRHWGLESLIQPVSLGVCELLTNVQRHVDGDKRCTLELRWTGRSLTAAVTDHDRRLPQVHSSPPEAARGRGLAMVASLSDSWGTHRTPEGKVVWFTLRTEVAVGLPLADFIVPPTDAVAVQPQPQGQTAGTEPADWSAASDPDPIGALADR
ncbi:ATP-binding protein [Streptomyces sp. H27-C3]|uniref:ATP-binding protein n=1 Tax=Streptomyces sp. H27-C3 TaxID=3046305 RepID=UPI0024BAE8D2|nr:ATP-binding protein [Streptomyces sp. H27-C3]MDJ0462452.1 ATP-binding protein [Streptomyces sp. H27-C3]